MLCSKNGKIHFQIINWCWHCNNNYWPWNWEQTGQSLGRYGVLTAGDLTLDFIYHKKVYFIFLLLSKYYFNFPCSANIMGDIFYIFISFHYYMAFSKISWEYLFYSHGFIALQRCGSSTSNSNLLLLSLMFTSVPLCFKRVLTRPWWPLSAAATKAVHPSGVLVFMLTSWDASRADTIWRFWQYKSSAGEVKLICYFTSVYPKHDAIIRGVSPCLSSWLTFSPASSSCFT